MFIINIANSSNQMPLRAERNLRMEILAMPIPAKSRRRTAPPMVMDIA